MSLFALADTHLSFAQPKPMDIFGSRWSGFENKLKENWNAVVGENDTVVMPGDISWSSDFAGLEPDFDFLASLNGKKIIGKGNHDYWWQTRKKLDGFVSSHGYTCFDFLQQIAFRPLAFTTKDFSWSYVVGKSCKQKRIFSILAEHRT